MDENNDMFISDGKAAVQSLANHLQRINDNDPSFNLAFKYLLAMLIVDVFMMRDKPKDYTAKDITDKYIPIFQSMGINLQSLDSDNA